MKRNFFIILSIALIGFALSLNLTGCKKEKPKDTPSVEESTEEDVPSDEETSEVE